MKTVRNFAAVLIAVVALAWVSTFAVAPSILPDFLRPAHGWRDLVPNFISTAGADNPGTPRVQGVPNGFPMPISALTNTSPPSYSNATTNPLSSDSAGNLRVTAGAPADVPVGPTSISAACSDANINTSCVSGRVSVALAGENGVSVTQVNSGFTGTVKPDCQLGNGRWVAGQWADPVSCALTTVSAGVTTDSNTFDRVFICPQGSQAAGIRGATLTAGTVSAMLRATVAGGMCSFYDASGTGSMAAKLVAGAASIGTVQIGNTPNTTPILASVSAGGNTASVKAASTASATTDLPLVVAQSPNPSPECTSFIAVNQTTGTTVITGTASQKIYICAVTLVSATAQNVSVIEGTGTVCASGTPIGILGGTTASMALAANGGLAMTAARPWFKGRTAADNICITQSGAGNVSGGIFYVSAP